MKYSNKHQFILIKGVIGIEKITNEKYENIVYISHPFGNRQENAEKVADIIVELQEKYPTYLFISPIHAFQTLYNVVDYETGIKNCLWLLEKCDEMWVICTPEEAYKSVGVTMEIDYCKMYRIPYYYKAGV